VISSLLYIQSEAKKERIELYLNIPGAVLRPALAIYDVINELKADGVQIATTNIALCAGMGALIAGAGTKGQRKSMPNARFLLQKTGMDGVFRGQASDIALEVANVKKWNEKINGEFAKVTGQPMDKIDNDLRRDFYLSSDEAVRYGLIDEVLMPTSSKRQPATSQMLDLGVFQSGQKYQGGGKSSRDEEPRRQQTRGSDDDAPTIGKA
jgi:ATP-dependent Clp protease protease subunit